MSTHIPKVSIGIPVYNGENFLSEAIECVLAQTYQDFEIILSDNGSTDATQEICEAYTAKDARISYYRSDQNRGAAWNFNQTFELSRGDYFKWLAHDDLMAPEFLERTVAVLDQDPEVVLAYTGVSLIDENRELIEEYKDKIDSGNPDPGKRFRALLLDWSLCFEVFGLIRRQALLQTPVMGNYGHGDGVLLARLGLLGRFQDVPEYLLFSRKHKKQSMREFGYEGGGNDYHRYTVWFDTSKAGRLLFPNWRIMGEYYRSIWMVSLSLYTRLYCHIVVARWIRHNVRNLSKDLLVNVRVVGERVRGMMLVTKQAGQVEEKPG
ncbi:MAG: glycosyltransferase family 2 protein [Ardenticatenaceae bacterium]|nr:glycosyltransferase family 2 protein [Ardenticatenaceae bacterium]MCB8988677.1 glycosyltransferase family 2 protein [Ardenticatenaceae bacterium]